MINQESLSLGQTLSVIRELFEYGNQRAKVVGRENIFDFSIGNPSVPPPPQVSMESNASSVRWSPAFSTVTPAPQVTQKSEHELRLLFPVDLR